MLEKSENDFNRPAISKYQGNHIRWHVQQICGNAKHSVTVHATSPPGILAACCVRIDAYTNHSNFVIKLAIPVAVQLDNFVADDCVEARVVVAIVRCDRFPDTVVSQSTDIAATRVRQ